MAPENRPSLYLPGEIVVHILSFVRNKATRQKTLHSCCLVSRQWYSAAIPLLYERPKVAGRDFDRFVSAISPSTKAYAPRGDLGRYVRRLDFSNLVHHSSNSLMARIIGRVKDRLEVFIAPASSFSVVCLSPLSKCKKMRVLNLSFVLEALDFEAIKKAVRNMDNLTTLKLPPRTEIDTTAENISWPPKLAKLKINGPIDVDVAEDLDWPKNITSLTVAGSTLQISPPPTILFNRYLSNHLKELTITFAPQIDFQRLCPLPVFMRNLTFLSLPGDQINNDLFFMLHTREYDPISLECLECGESPEPARFSIERFTQALETTLARLRAFGFHQCHCTEKRITDDAELEEMLQANAVKAGYDKGEIESGELQVGVYYFD
ncbi:hypothetical protein FQN50_004218 [Emmonsiellopsis sp. PD_5]|nr:hypothetical protein FQN50_004218 [Emmonsiellopsis sp. PD_5]